MVVGIQELPKRAECMVEGWRNSPGHYRNMIGDFAELGVGITFSKDSIVFGTQISTLPSYLQWWSAARVAICRFGLIFTL